MYSASRGVAVRPCWKMVHGVSYQYSAVVGHSLVSHARGSTRDCTQHHYWCEGGPMSTLTLAYTVHTYSTGTPGRAICNARTHQFVSDGVGSNAVGAGELLHSGVPAYAVNMARGYALSRSSMASPLLAPYAPGGSRCRSVPSPSTMSMV
jgi:hypothetical protein